MITKLIFLASMALVASVATAPVRAAEAPTGITVVAPSGALVNLGLRELAELPTTQVQANFLTESGPHSASFEGPLLWAVLQKAGAIDPANHREQVSRTIMVLGRDGYRAMLAIGEIAPEFEAKQVILAERMVGKPLDADHLRIVVPLDKRGGRSVRDVTRIEVGAPSLAQ